MSHYYQSLAVMPVAATVGLKDVEIVLLLDNNSDNGKNRCSGSFLAC